MALPEDAQGWLDDIVEPATWIAAGFPQPVTYEGSRAVNLQRERERAHVERHLVL